MGGARQGSLVAVPEWNERYKPTFAQATAACVTVLTFGPKSTRLQGRIFEPSNCSTFLRVFQRRQTIANGVS
jgi:hypothetical protein